MVIYFFFKQKTAYEMRISDWSSDVCSSDLRNRRRSLHDHQSRRQNGRHPAPNNRHIFRRRNYPAYPCRPRCGVLYQNSCPVSHFRFVPIRSGLSDGRTSYNTRDRKSVVYGTSVSVRVGLGGRSLMKKKKKTMSSNNHY